MNTMLILNKHGKLKNMKNTTARFKVAALTGILLLIATIGVSASLMAQYTIPSSGTIALETRPSTSSFASASQLRYTYFGSESMLAPDWNLIASTIKSYDMGPVIQKALYTYLLPSELVQWRGGVDKIREAIDALHAQGIKYHLSWAIMYGDWAEVMNGVGNPPVAPPRGDMRQIRDDGTPEPYWADPNNPLFRDFVKQIAEELVRDYEIDGLSFDYVRYDGEYTSFSQYNKAAFEQYLGETISDSDFRTGGAFTKGGLRFKEFMQWRMIPINELVRDMRTWMDTARQLYHPELPPLEYTATVFGDTVYNLWWIGQDATSWVKDGSVDVLLPMLYDQDMTKNMDRFILAQNLLGGPEGIIPLAPLLSHVAHGGTKTPAQLQAEVSGVMQRGSDGWSTWAYGGPGDDSGWPDIRPYWDLVPRPQIFSLSNITVSSTANSATITWKTELPASSKVEYSTSPLFNASKIKAPSEEYPYNQLDYWDIDYIPGTSVESSTPVTSHSVTVTGLSPGVVYYFRVQSQDSSGIATSKVYTFQF